MKKFSILLALVLSGLVVSMALHPAYAQDFPTKDIRWYVPSKPGGGFDVYARAVGVQMLKYLPKQVKAVFLNIPAGGGVEAVTRLYAAKPDGYTLGIVKVPGSIVSQLTMPSIKYDVEKFGYLGNITTDPYSIVVKKDSPLNSIQDMAKKGKIKFSTTGVGATSWVNSVIFSKELGITPSFVHFTSSADAILAVIRGDSEALMLPLFTGMSYAESGDVKFLAAFAKQRVEGVDVPTIAEAGYPNLASLSLSRVVATAPGTPPEIVKILEDALWKTLHDKELIDNLAKAKRPIIGSTKGAEAKEMVMDSVSVFAKYGPELKKSLK